MNEITKQQLLELSHDYVIVWHDVQTHRNGMTHDNLDSSIEKGSLRAIIFFLKCKAGWREEEPEVREIPPI